MKPELSRTFVCNGCWGFFKDMKMLNRHKNSTQNKACVQLKLNKCEDCNKIVKSKDIFGTPKKCCKPSVCPMCGILCINKKKLFKHGLCHKTFGLIDFSWLCSCSFPLVPASYASIPQKVFDVGSDFLALGAQFLKIIKQVTKLSRLWNILLFQFRNHQRICVLHFLILRR